MSAPVVLIDARRAKSSAARISAQARSMAAELGVSREIHLPLPTDDAQHLAWFDGGTPTQPARPILSPDGPPREAAVAALREKVAASMRAERRLNLQAAFTAAASAMKGAWVRRLETNGGDLRLAPLSARYRAMKQRRGLDPRIGVARGRLLASLRRALPVVRTK